jgi:LemA protein
MKSLSSSTQARAFFGVYIVCCCLVESFKNQSFKNQCTHLRLAITGGDDMALALGLWILIIVVAIIVIWIIAAYNGLIILRNRIENAWSQIDVQLKRRYDLIPNLIETVKGYAKHEKTVFTEVTKARTALQKAKTLPQKSKASDMITSALKTLFAVSENYPDLKANQNFMMLQEELSGTETKIAYARQFYNDSVLKLNQRIQVFPTSIIAGMFNFREKDYFKTEAKAEREPVKVKF